MTRACLSILTLASLATAQNFTLDQATSYPYPNELAAAPTGSRLAWAANERGKRNLFAAEGPTFTPRRLTNFTDDDGQELTSVSLTRDGKQIIFVRGGDHGANWDPSLPVNPTFAPTPPKVQVWSIAFNNGNVGPKLIGEGDQPEISPDGATVAFVKGGQAFTASTDGTSKAAKAIFTTRGTVADLQWSPDGTALAFTANRGDHSFIGIYRGDGKPIVWLDPGFTRDRSPQWSPDGKRIAFVRTPGAGGAPKPILLPQLAPWSIWTADTTTGTATAKKIWDSPTTLRGSVPASQGGTNFHWAALGRIVFLSYQDGWPHMYSVPETGGEALLLTPGNYMTEEVTLSEDRKTLLFQANTGPDNLDLDRRHVVRAAVDKQGIEVLTPGDGIETSPVMTGDGTTVAFFSATVSRPGALAVRGTSNSAVNLVGASMIPTDMPWSQFVTPKQVVYKSPDGVTVHAQLFEKPGGSAKKPAIVFVHGGPMRQMLLGWHYGDYYSNSYAMNQYLASRGFVVLSVNYRLGIGYGYDFQRPANGGAAGASEYQDVKAGGEWLAKQPQVDPTRIGIYGGSYGGFLTAMALAKDSRLFAAGVDVHGVHDWTQQGRMSFAQDRYEKAPDFEKAAETGFKSSPVAYVSGWKSPVLFIHGDDDRNVRFNQSVDLIRRLERSHVPMEMMVVVDDTHHFMRHANQLRVDEAIAEFLERKLMGMAGMPSANNATGGSLALAQTNTIPAPDPQPGLGCPRCATIGHARTKGH